MAIFVLRRWLGTKSLNSYYQFTQHRPDNTQNFAEFHRAEDSVMFITRILSE
jgi:hypothetical protein